MIIILFLFISSPPGLGFLFTHGEVYKFIYVQKRNKNNTTNLKVAVHEQCTHGFSKCPYPLMVFKGVFGDRIISHGLWPACSPDLTPSDSYLWGNLKDKTYRKNPHTKKD
jgi:hypothetical protein